MKHKVTLLAVVLTVLAAPFAAHATYQFTAVAPSGQTLYYNLLLGQAIVTYPGTQQDNPWNGYEKPTGALVIPDSVTYNGMNYAVTQIAPSAFAGCTGLTSVTIGENVTMIGSSNGAYFGGSFYGCTSLSTVVMPSGFVGIGQYTFCGCSSLSSIDLSHASYILASAFSGCTSLTSVTFSNELTTISQFAFFGCTSLASVTFGSGLTSILSHAFSGCTSLVTVEVPVSVQSIGTDAFIGVTNVVYNGGATGSPWGASYVNAYIENGMMYTDVQKHVLVAAVGGGTTATVEPTVTHIMPNAFQHCDSLTTLYVNAPSCTTASGCGLDMCGMLTSVVFADSVAYIPRGLCMGCTGLSSVQLPSTVSVIGDHAFLGCTGLTSVTFPASLQSIGEMAFYGCTGLTQVTIGRDMQSIGAEAFGECGITTVSFDAENCIGGGNGALFGTAVSTLTLGDNVRMIPSRAFEGCASLTTVTFPTSLQNIGDMAFAGCTGLSSVTFPTSLHGINPYAFYGCTGLTSVTFPASLQSIGEMAFYGCTGLTQVTIGRNMQSIGAEAFGECGITTVSFDAENCIGGGNSALFGTAVSTLTLGDNVRTIPSRAFEGCASLTTVTFPTSLQSIGQYAFRGCTALVSVSLPDNVETVGSGVFEGCVNLTSANLGNGLTVVPAQMFYRCLRLMSVRLGDALTAIGSSAFRECGIIGELVIPQGIISIDYCAFYECYGINEITALGRVAPTLGDFAFYGVDSSIAINVPCNTTNLYAGRWQHFCNFNEIPFLFNAISENLSKGTVTVVQEPTCDVPQAVVQATAKTGYRFDRWSDGSTDNPYTYTVAGSGTLIAYFVSTSAVDDAAAVDVQVVVRDGMLAVQGVPQDDIKVYNMAGCLVDHRSRLAAGVYVVRVGEQTVRKVVAL